MIIEDGLKPKPGLISTEFWVVLVVLAIANAFPLIMAKYPNSEILQTISIVMAGIVDTIVTLGYLVARTKAKGGNGGYVRTSSLVALFLALSVAATLFAGCSVNKDFVKGSELTYKAIAPEYSAYVKADPKLDKDGKALRLLTLETWKTRIDAWKKEVSK